jgi:large subunit ribosomal protein L28
VQNVSIYVPELGRSVNLRVSTSALRTINKIGLTAYLQKNQLALKDVV